MVSFGDITYSLFSTQSCIDLLRVLLFGAKIQTILSSGPGTHAFTYPPPYAFDFFFEDFFSFLDDFLDDYTTKRGEIIHTTIQKFIAR